MSWLRTDESFDTHRKMLALGDGVKGDARRWTWTRVLLYTARHESAEIPWNISETVPRATRQFLADCAAAGLADTREDGTLIVHDWPLYADISIAEKVAYYLEEKNHEASANEIARALGGRRELILAEVNRQRAGSQPGTTEPPETPDPPVPGNCKSGSRSGTSPLPPHPQDQKHSPPLTYYGDDPNESSGYNHALERIITACGGTPDARTKLLADQTELRVPEARLLVIEWAITQNGTKDRLGKARAMMRTPAGLATDQ